ncbi:retinol dehydrogenase [Arthrobacter sp. Soil782]|uniref:SDR family oxidoreductase n=1 Tax=Arthrobacter sp. Soil782 TaxID=1736410 RepID=UPI0006FFF175|nr:SDR family oxidoreductase [Arthrobacter sp. Soil782]KRF05296.1 retinol dehydrogenase [Arthrobacter sp. Soil782]
MATALITGAGRGIGQAISLRLARAGWTVFAGVRDDAGKERLTAGDGHITPVQLDITDAAHLSSLADQLPERLDALVNNAGIGVLGPIESVTPADLRHQFDVNVFGQVAVTQAVLPRLRAARGRIVFISSTGGRTVVPLEGAYCASKFALEALADALRVELRPWCIGVSLVEPGPTDTGSWREVQRMIDDMETGMSPAHRELYSRHTAGLRSVVSRFAPRAMPPDAVARVVERALTARRPRARYPAGADAHVMIALNAILPTRVGDAVGARVGGVR